MSNAAVPVFIFIHRHTGGLESYESFLFGATMIHRHTGGLENLKRRYVKYATIHRHTGGLENDQSLLNP